MTLSPWIIYLWGIADSVIAFFGTLSIVAGIIGVIATAIGFVENVSRGKKLGLSALAVAVFSGVLSVLVPSSKTVAVMVVAPAIVNSEPIQKDLPELYRAAKDALMGTLREVGK